MTTPVLICDVVTRPPSPIARIIVRELMLSSLVLPERLIDQVWGQDEDGGPLSADNEIRVYISKIRRILRHPYAIERVCRGYMLVRNDHDQATEGRPAARRRAAA